MLIAIARAVVTNGSLLSSNAARRARRSTSARAAGGDDVTLRVVLGGYHEPFNDPGGEALVDEVADWILARALVPAG